MILLRTVRSTPADASTGSDSLLVSPRTVTYGFSIRLVTTFKIPFFVLSAYLSRGWIVFYFFFPGPIIPVNEAVLFFSTSPHA